VRAGLRQSIRVSGRGPRIPGKETGKSKTGALGQLRRGAMIQDVYLLTVHEPYESHDHPVPINATIVHAKTLLHPQVPQPDGGRMYRCLTEFPGRSTGCIVPASTLTAELDGGLFWPLVADWERVVEAVIHLSRSRSCDAMPLGLPMDMAASLSSGPNTSLTVHYPDRREILGAEERQAFLRQLEHSLRGAVSQRPFWPGNDLLEPPSEPKVMPYKLYR
jgi:hypothetical protein